MNGQFLRRSLPLAALGVAGAALAYKWLQASDRAENAAAKYGGPATPEAQLRRIAGGAPLPGAITVEKTVTIYRSPEELYAFWRDFARLPTVLRHVERVEENGRRSRWTLTGPARRRITWEAEITEEIPGRSIAWRSLPGSEVQTRGAMKFYPAPGGRGTAVKALLSYAAPGGRWLAKVARAFGESPEQQIKDDLRRFKQLMETGEIATTDGQPHGKRG